MKDDVNKKYRGMAIFILTQCGRDEGRRALPVSVLRERYGLSWNSYAHELMIKGMIHLTYDDVRLKEAWRDMPPSERMQSVLDMYPYVR